ncbi:MAG: GNAT family N-acetyltransferase [Actinobacteria bacterium]|nr:GNAT family N-acetyltransferase [Actinomycetota bacterium]
MPSSAPTVAASVREAVLARRPVDAREHRSIASFVELFDGLERPFDEHAARVHVTASAIVVAEDRRRVVLHLHKRLQKWLQPGGHIDTGESPSQAALREAAEETGLPVVLVSEALIHVDVHPGPRGHTHLDLRYLIESPHVRPAPAAQESQQVQWFAWHQAIDLAEPGLEGVLRAAQPGEAKIRAVRNTDAGGCAQVYMRSREFALPTVPVVHAPREVRRWMADEVVGRTDMWVAEVDGTIVGLLVLAVDAKDVGWVEQLYLDPAWMGRGLGDRFVQLAKERVPGGLQLWTFQVNEPARRFYERHGFIAEQFTDGAGNEERSPDIRYRWSP